MPIPADEQNPLVLRSSTPSIEWTSQWPIGTGRFGALVGGTAEHEIVPLSISGLYVSRKDRHVKRNLNTSKLEDFRAARESLRNGDIDNTLHYLAEISENSVGMFQYAADLNFAFSRNAFISSTLVEEKSNNRKPSPKQPQRRPPSQTISSRRRSKLDISKELEGKFQKNEGSELLSDSLHFFESNLDMKHGVVSAVHVTANPKTNIITGTTRDWFASNTDQVIVADFKCIIADDVSKISNCMNAALRVARQDHPDYQVNTVSQDIKPYNISSTSEKAAISSYSLDLSFSESSQLLLPNVHICAVFTCSSSVNAYDSQFSFHKLDTAEDVLVCNGADSFSAIISVSLDQHHIVSKEPSPSGDVIAKKLQIECWNKLSPAVALGISELRSRHVADFSKQMSLTQLDIKSPPQPTNRTSTDTLTISRMYQYARYLHLSSARHSVSNLQGLWADGPTSAWSGTTLISIILFVVLNYLFSSYKRRLSSEHQFARGLLGSRSCRTKRLV